MPYRMYIDECGTDDVVSCHIPQHRFLALTGVVMALDHVANVATPRLNDLKLRHFGDRDPDGPPLVLHRSDYLGRKGDFGCLSDQVRMEAFQEHLEAYLRAIDHTVITVVLDKHAMLNRAHWRNKEPYHYCAEVLAEKFVQLLERKQSTGTIYAESRKGAKNRRLQDAFSQVCQTGSQFVRNFARYAARLETFSIEFREKKHNNTGIQIADTYAKPSMDRIMWHRDNQHMRTDFSKRFGAILWDAKYDRSPAGSRWGYGAKYLP